MKKALLILVAACMAAASNARILRVSNVNGSSAPYSSIEAAQDAASSGDTIMVDASSTRYTVSSSTNIDLTKKLVILGPGYWLVQDGVVEEGASSASVGSFTVKVEGTVIKGMTMGTLSIEASNVVVNRCNIGYIKIDNGASNAIISQNFITGSPSAYYGSGSLHQVTNNIFTYYTSSPSNPILTGFNQSYIAYNTFRSKYVNMNLTDCTVEHNLWAAFNDQGSNNSVTNNYETDIINIQATNDFIDKDYYALEIPADVINTYGAFAGDSPYILAGVPSGPVIQDLVVPTTVEVGSKLNVTVKIGMMK